MIDNYRDTLKQKGLKNTKRRTAILDILEGSEQPVPAEQIYSELSLKRVPISLSTVYRALDSLVSKELVTKLNLCGDNRTLFELNKNTHSHHLICLGCKKIQSIDHCPIKAYEDSLGKEMDFAVAGHKLDIYGYCSKCRVNQGSSNSKSH